MGATSRRRAPESVRTTFIRNQGQHWASSTLREKLPELGLECVEIRFSLKTSDDYPVPVDRKLRGKPRTPPFLGLAATLRSSNCRPAGWEPGPPYCAPGICACASGTAQQVNTSAPAHTSVFAFIFISLIWVKGVSPTGELPGSTRHAHASRGGRCRRRARRSAAPGKMANAMTNAKTSAMAPPASLPLN